MRLMQNKKIHTPKDFARVPRDVKYLAHFKASELRQFLLYGGIVLLKDHLPADAYIHFLRLSLRYRIVHEAKLSHCLDIAQIRFEDYVAEYNKYYPHAGLPYNVHNLLHIVADVKRYGPVQGFSAYKYENSIRLLEKYIKKPAQILQQIYKRLAENKNAKILSPNARVHKWRINKGDTFILKDSLSYADVCEVNGNDVTVREYSRTVNFFETPIPSKELHIGMTESYKGDILLASSHIDSSKLITKCYKIPF